MKRVLSLVLVLVLVLSAVMPAFAEDAATDVVVSDATTQLAEFGIIEGDGNSFNEAGPLTRAAMAKTLAFFYGEQVAAEAFEVLPTFTDVQDADMWYTPWVAYAEQKTWMIGDGAGKTFRPADAMKAQEVNKLMLTVLGYVDVEWDAVNAKAAELEVAVTASDLSLVTRGEAFAAIRTVLDAKPMDSETTLGTNLEIEGYEAPVVAGTDLAVTSVTAPNARQVVVEFNKAVDADTIKAASVKVYVGTATAVTTWTHTLSADGKTLVLGLSADVAQDTAVKVVVNGVADATVATELIEASEMTTTMKDLVNPVILNVNATTSKTFVIETSEPLAITVAEESYHVLNNIKIGGVALVGKLSQDMDANKITVELGTKLAVGTHAIEYTGAKDVVGFSAAAFTGSIIVVEDITTATVTGVTFVDINTIKVTFDEPVAAAGTLTVDGNATTLGALSADKMTQTLTLSPALGLANIIKTTLSYNGTVDMEGNTITTAKTFEFVATDDLVAPTATVTITAANKVKVVFSETVSAAGTLTVKNAAGTTIATGALVLDSTDTTNKTYVSANAVALTAGAYTAELKDSADNGVRANKIITVSTPLTTLDITAPTIEQVVTKTAYAAGPPVVNGQAQLYFSEAMDAATATTLTNYMIDFDGAGGTAAVQLSSITGGAAALSADGKVVTLTIPGATYAAGTTTVAVLAVKDVTANLIATADFNVAKTISTNAPALTESGFEMVAKNQIKVTFTNPLVAVDPSNFVVQDGSTTPDTALAHLVGVGYTLDATNKIATITLSGNLTVDGMIIGDNEAAELVITAGNTKDIYGTASEQTVVDLVDKVAPSIKTVMVQDDTTNSNKIVLTFDEEVYASTAAIVTDLKVMVNATTPYQLPTSDYTVTNNNNTTITLTLAPSVAITGKTITVELLNNRYLADDSSNANAFATANNHATVFAAMTVKNAAATANFEFGSIASATPVITTAATTLNAANITITGTTAAGSTVAITGGVAPVNATVTGTAYTAVVSLTQDAANTLSVVATDVFGNVSTAATVIITEDSTAPAAAVITTAATTLNAANITVTGTTEAGSTVAITGGAAPVAATVTGTAYTAVVTLTQDAANTLSVVSTDVASNNSVAATVVITEDSTDADVASVAGTYTAATATDVEAGETVIITLTEELTGASATALIADLTTTFANSLDGDANGTVVQTSTLVFTITASTGAITGGDDITTPQTVTGGTLIDLAGNTTAGAVNID